MGRSALRRPASRSAAAAGPHAPPTRLPPATAAGPPGPPSAARLPPLRGAGRPALRGPLATLSYRGHGRPGRRSRYAAGPRLAAAAVAVAQTAAARLVTPSLR